MLWLSSVEELDVEGPVGEEQGVVDLSHGVLLTLPLQLESNNKINYEKTLMCSAFFA